MNPKKIIIKTLYKNLNTQLCKSLDKLSKINYFSKKINGVYVTTIKCSNYYKNANKSDDIYGSYVYLYTSVSIILSQLIIDFFERKFINILISDYYFYFSKNEQEKIKNISSMILDYNFPCNSSKELYLYKKDLILSKLLLNFRKQNHIQIEGFASFELDNYFSFLDDAIEKSAHIYFSNLDPDILINFMLNNFFK